MRIRDVRKDSFLPNSETGKGGEEDSAQSGPDHKEKRRVLCAEWPDPKGREEYSAQSGPSLLKVYNSGVHASHSLPTVHNSGVHALCAYMPPYVPICFPMCLYASHIPPY